MYKKMLAEYEKSDDTDGFGNAPSKLIIECYDAIRKTERFYEKALNQRWIYENGILTEQKIDIDEDDDIPQRDGAFYIVATARFYYDLEKKKAFIDMVYGPRFAQGYSFDIKNEDSLYPSLENQEIKWIS